MKRFSFPRRSTPSQSGVEPPHSKTLARLRSIFEKLLPARWWQKPIALNEDQWWTAFAGTEAPQTKAVLHVAQDKFVTYIQGAAQPGAPGEERLRNLDRAMAIADFMSEVDNNFAVAKDEVARREAMKQQQQNAA